MEHKLYVKCNVCLENFSDEHSPRNLACGHSVCSPCIEQLLSIDNHCPECRVKYVAESVNDLSLNYPILRISRIFKFAELDSEKMPLQSLILKCPPKETRQSAGTCSIHGYSLFFICMRCITWVCRGCLAVDHPEPPRGRCFITNLTEGMNKIKANHQKVLSTYISKSERIDNNLRYIARGHSVALQYCSETKYIGKNLNCEVHSMKVIKQKEKVQSQITVLENVMNSLKKASEIMKEIIAAEGFMAANEGCFEIETNFENIMAEESERKNNNFLDIFLPGNMGLEELLTIGKLVYATLEKDGKNRWSSVVMKENKVHLCSLRDGDPPDNGFIIPFEVLLTTLSQESPTVFMEIGCDGKSIGFVYIQMFGNTARGRQTVLLCSGERGPSYRNTRINMPEPADDGWCDCLTGGDYENNDGSGGPAIVDDITDDDIYIHDVKEGMFGGFPTYSEPKCLGNFFIVLKNDPGEDAENIFGIVIKGLQLLKGEVVAAQTIDKTVIDCGVIIPL